MSTCCRCHQEKPDTEFYRRRQGGSGWTTQAYCKVCSREAQREYTRRNPEKVREWTRRHREKVLADAEKYAAMRARVRAWHQQNYTQYRADVEDCGLRARYGLGREELQQMLADQGGECALCAKPITWASRHVDHIDTPHGPHVRAILCQKCNNGLGMFNEDPDLLQKAAEFVALHAYLISRFGPLEAVTL